MKKFKGKFYWQNKNYLNSNKKKTFIGANLTRWYLHFADANFTPMVSLIPWRQFIINNWIFRLPYNKHIYIPFPSMNHKITNKWKKKQTNLQNEVSTYGFETPKKSACKHLWKCCMEHHAFFRLVRVPPSSSSGNTLPPNSNGTNGDLFTIGSRFRSRWVGLILTLAYL